MRSSIIHRSISRPKLIGGVAARVFSLLSGLGVLVIYLQAWPLLLVLPPLYWIGRWITGRDAKAVDVYVIYMREADVLDPWVKPTVSRMRPPGFGRGLNC